MKIVVSGMVAGDPHHGGATWAVLQWVLGLRRLGHDVMLVEPVDGEPQARVRRYFSELVEEFDLHDRAALVVRGGETAASMRYSAVRSFSRDAEVLFNLSGMLDEAIVESIPRRVYVDLDPAFTQLWHVVDGIDMGFDRHTHFVTVGLGVGTESTVPTAGREWLPTPPPVVLEHWPVATAIACEGLTTVGSWRSYGSISQDGVRYGQKAHSVRALIDLPARTDWRVVLAMGIHPDEKDDIERLHAHGWTLVDPRRVAGSPSVYRHFIAGSKAELGIAKEGYVVSRSGWFSDRSACYLASGRPVIAQDTGFSPALPTGDGLFAFSDVDDVLAAIEDLRSDYTHHARAARQIAEEHLESDRVLSRVLDEVGAC